MPGYALNIDPLPTVNPIGAPGGDFERIQANPDMFGGSIARALQGFGGAVEKASDVGFQVAEQQQQLHSRINVDDQVNNWITRRDAILRGDPSKTVIGPTGMPQPDTGFLGLEGRAASDKRAETLQALEEQRLAGRKNLSTPYEQLTYDLQTRRMYSEAENNISAHADAQWKNWAAGVSGAGANHDLNAFVNAIGNPDEMKMHAENYVKFKVQQATLKFGNDPQIEEEAQANAKRDLLKAHTDAVAVHDPKRAIEILDSNKKTAGVLYDDMYNRLRARAETQTGIGAANKYVTMAAGGQLSIPKQQVASTASEEWRKAGASPNAIAGVMFNINEESGFISSLRHPDQPHWGGEAHFAHGLYQEGGAEWNRYQYWLSINHPGSNWQDPKSQSEFAAWNLKTNYPATWARMNAAATPQDAAAIYAREYLKPADQYLQSRLNKIYGGAPIPASYSGNTAAASTSGNVPSPGSVMRAGGFEPVGAPQTPTPSIFQTGPTRAEQLGAALNAAITDPDLNDRERDIAVRSIETQFRTMEIAEGQQEKVKKQVAATAADGYLQAMTAGRHSPNYDPVALLGQINADPRLDYELRKALTDRITRESGEEQALSYGPHYLQARESLFSPPGTPGHIDDFSQLVLDPGITEAGLRDLHARMTLVKGDVDHQAIERRMNSFLRYAKQQMSFEEDTGFIKIRDPKGEAIYSGQFEPDFIKHVSDLSAQAQKGGDRKKLDEFLSIENVKNLVRQYRNPQEMQADRLAATGDALGEKGAPTQQQIPATPEGINPAHWLPVVSRPPVTASGKVWPVSAWANVLQNLHDNPTDEAKAAFTKRFGLDADTILESFKERLPSAETPAEPAQPAGPGFFQRLFESEKAKTGEFYKGPEPAEELKQLDERERALAHSGLGGAFLAAQQKRIADRRRELQAASQ